MTTEELNAWLISMNWNQQRAAKELGVSRNSLSKYMKHGAPQLVALACLALKAQRRVGSRREFPIECGIQQGYAIEIAKSSVDNFKLAGQGMDRDLYERTIAWYKRDCPEGTVIRGLFVRYEVEILE